MMGFVIPFLPIYLCDNRASRSSVGDRLMLGRALLGGGRVHPEGPPAVPVEIFERAAVHEAMVLGIVRFAAARGDRGFGARAHLGAAARQSVVSGQCWSLRVAHG